MTSAVYEAISYAMRYWFIAVVLGTLIAMIYISYKEYREKKSVRSELDQYVGYLEIVGGPEQFIGDRFGIRPRNWIGRSKRDDIVLPDASVEQSHAQLYMDGDRLILEPGARGSTKINGRRAVRRHALKTGDVFSIGDVDFAVYIRRTRVGMEH